jgi:hypothetical protein
LARKRSFSEVYCDRISGIGSLKGPQNRTLTTGVDSGDAYTGTAADDRFFGTDTTVNLGDSIVGGAGTDTLAITSAAATAFPVVKTVGIETYEIQALVTGASLGLNNSTTDVTAINFVDSLDAAGAAAFTVSNLALSTGIGISNSGTQVTAVYNTTATSTSDAVTLTLNKSSANAALVTDGGVDKVNIVSNGASNTLASIGDAGDTDLTSFAVTGAGNLTVTAALEAQVSSFDASAATGKISVKTTNNAAPNTTVSSVDVTDITIKGGSAADVINVSANAADNEVSVNAGGGDDTVTILAGAAYSAATSTNAGDSIVGGDGQDTLVVAGNLSATDLSKAISGFEVIKFTADASGTDMSVNKLGVSNFIVSGIGVDAVLTGLAANSQVTVTDGIDTADEASLTATIGTDTTADVINVSLESSSAEVTAVTYETVNLNSTKSATDASTVTNTAVLISATSATALNISGTQGLTITTAALKASAAVTSTSSGAVTSTFTTALKSYTGGDAKDDVTLAAGGLTAAGTFNGGAGTTDILRVTATDAQDLGVINVSNFESLALTAGATASTTVTADLRNVTDVATLSLVAGAGGTNSFTVNRMSTSTTVAVAAATTAVTTSLNSGSSVALKLTTTAAAITTFNVDGSTTSVTVTADDGDATAAETGAAVDFVGTALATITVLGSDHVNLNTAEATVTKVDGSGSTGGFTVTAASATAATLIGSSVVDTITGGGAADIITGGKGNDVLSGGAGADSYVFAATGALNGTDTVTVVAGAGGDKLNFAAFLSGGSVEQNGGLGSAMVAFTSGSINDVNITNKVALYSDAADANIDSAAEIAALIQGAGDAFSLTSGGKAIIIAGDAAGAGVARVWFVDDSLGATAGTIEADDIVQVAIDSDVTFDLDLLINSNFAFV